jgi:nicotinamide-nucleotide amidase
MDIAILTIGDELLNGDTADTNKATIARFLADHSFAVREAATIGDAELDIVSALRRLADAADVVIVTGGLGPTEDDRTARAAAKAFHRNVTLNERALESIRERFRAWGREMHPRNEKQALLPSRSTVIVNQNGTAPGFLLQDDETELYFLPGVPAEMERMLAEFVLPRLQSRWPDPPQQIRRSVSVFGLSEPQTEERLLQAELPSGVEVAYNVTFPIVKVKLRASGPDAEHRIDRAELTVRRALGDAVFGVGDESLPGNTARLLRLAGLTLSLAESCTGGLIAKLLTDQPGASQFLERSVVSYANSAKSALLGIPAALIEHYGAVSGTCAREMARGVRRTAGTDIGLAVTGIAGPDGGSVEKPVGTVFIAMDTVDETRVERFRFHGDRDRVRLRTACTALDWLRLHAARRIAD